MTKTLYIKTYGCQMNVYDSSRMEDMLAPMGYATVDSPDSADLVVLNTCHIREKAAEKMYSELGRIRRMKEAKAEQGEGRMLIAVAGCVGQAEGEEVIRRAPYVDMVVGPQSYQQLPDMVARILRDEGNIIHLDFAAQDKFDKLPEERVRRQTQAFLTIQEGCDKFCTFCVVPYTRGAEYSRPVAEVLKEAKQQVAAGAVEITLLGQNVNAYHGEGPGKQEWGLARLIYALAEVEGLQRIRYTTSHPRDMDAELIKAHGEVPQLMPFLHLPVQSGSNRILRKMNRKHTREDYLRIIDGLRDAQPDMAFCSDFIVGFPGETEEDFADTMRLVEEVNYAQAFSFNYSIRPGTPAAGQEAQVPDDVKSRRLTELQTLLRSQSRVFNTACEGKILPVLVEKPGREAGELVARTAYMQPVHLHGLDVPVGTMMPVEIVQALGHSLVGQVVSDAKKVAA